MNIHCANNWLYHLWDKNFQCRRCGAIGKSRAASTLEVYPSHAASLSTTRPVDHPDQLDLPLDQPSEAGDSSFACVADNLVALVVP